MANFKFNVSDSTFKVEQLESVVTECATIYNFRVISEPGNSIRLNLDRDFQSFDNAFYTVLGVETPWDGTELILNYGPDLYFSFSLGNSGTPGVFLKCNVDVRDDTTLEEYNYFTTKVVRQDDSLPCDDPTGQGGTFDELTDTPANKTGSSLKIVRVNVTEDGLEYVDAGTLGSDLNYTHTQAVSSASWVIAHNLGKVPTIFVQDDLGNTVFGDIVITDLNNLTINFNTGFTGTAYLN